MKLKHILIVPAILASSVANAQIYSFGLGAANTGWVDSAGNGDNANSNYIAGNVGSDEYRNYFTFDLSDINGLITDASITITLPDGGVISNDNDEIFALSSVDSVVGVNDTISSNTSLFDDLGDGGFVGSSIVSNAGGTVTINLNQEFLDNANNSNMITIGGSVISLQHDGENEFIFGFSGDSGSETGSDAVTLNLTVDPNGSSVPEPSSTLLVSLASLALLTRRNR